ncbi:MAG: hypothetical protein EA350_13375 [Gemmatimonadales bacterium]|nr:MAG: hypothetical protein EA350_13375 [Gemmatimonadales bacterium]
MTTVSAFLLAAPSALSPALVLQAAPAAGTDDGLTLAEILQSLPVDPGSIFALLLLAAFVGGVVWFGTRGGSGGGRAPDPS